MLARLAAFSLVFSALQMSLAAYLVTYLHTELIDPARYPALAELSERAERLAPFRAAPHGLGTCSVSA